jgi:hypothetical protein
MVRLDTAVILRRNCAQYPRRQRVDLDCTSSSRQWLSSLDIKIHERPEARRLMSTTHYPTSRQSRIRFTLFVLGTVISQDARPSRLTRRSHAHPQPLTSRLPLPSLPFPPLVFLANNDSTTPCFAAPARRPAAYPVNDLALTIPRLKLNSRYSRSRRRRLEEKGRAPFVSSPVV